MEAFNFYGMGDFIKSYNFKNKKRNVESYIVYMLNRVMQMFEYKNLPETMPKRMIELYTMVNGHSVVLEYNDNLYVCFGGFGGEPNEYYMPTKYIVANPYLKLFDTFTIDENCVLVRNDTMLYGLMPMFRRYATAIVENDITMNMISINSRIPSLIDARDDATRASAKKYIDDIEQGENGVIASSAFFDGIRVQPYTSTTKGQLIDLIEYQQYIKANWYNELGIDANFNMKREAIGEAESMLNNDMLYPLVDDMLECRKEAIDKINSMFGTNISIDWASTWKDNQIELDLEQERMKEGEMINESTDESNDENDVS